MRALLAGMIVGLLLIVVVIQNSTITGQQKLIREMVGNPSCMVGR